MDEQEQQPQEQQNVQVEPSPQSPSPSHTKLIIGIVVVFVLAGLGMGGYFLLPKLNSKPVVCSEELKICPDGSGVAREGPSCEFAECPNSIGVDETKCTDYSVVRINNNEGFNYTYNKDVDRQAVPEKKFEGILKENSKLPPGVSSFVMRKLTYSLDDKLVYTTENDLSKYVGKRVILTGKNYKFELEGTQRDEIWPVSIVCK